MPREPSAVWQAAQTVAEMVGALGEIRLGRPLRFVGHHGGGEQGRQGNNVQGLHLDEPFRRGFWMEQTQRFYNAP